VLHAAASPLLHAGSSCDGGGVDTLAGGVALEAVESVESVLELVLLVLLVLASLVDATVGAAAASVSVAPPSANSGGSAASARVAFSVASASLHDPPPEHTHACECSFHTVPTPQQ
jgi:hypothetical protein